MSDQIPSQPESEKPPRDVGMYAWTLMQCAKADGFGIVEMADFDPVPLLALGREEADAPCRIYLSGGVHGDEPAGSLAMLELLENHRLPKGPSYQICPLLNPWGMAARRRENGSGVDLNRDYKSLIAPEVKAHVSWFRHFKWQFDLAICLHEDWEATGFYLYEVNPDGLPGIAETLREAARPIVGVDPAGEIDGRLADVGIIRPEHDIELLEEWPEAAYLIAEHTRLSYTLETPSSAELSKRVDALATAVVSGIEAFLERY